jgi:hypothetical protein
MRTTRSALSLCLALLLLAAGCVEPRASLGNVSLRPYESPGATLVTYGVQEGRVVSGNLDLSIDPRDGCARGDIPPGTVVVLCPKKLDDPPSELGGELVRWSGMNGALVTEVSADKSKLRVDGYLGQGLAVRQVHVTLRFERGPQWDELRQHPVLYAVAAAITGLSGEPPDDAR